MSTYLTIPRPRTILQYFNNKAAIITFAETITYLSKTTSAKIRIGVIS